MQEESFTYMYRHFLNNFFLVQVEEYYCSKKSLIVSQLKLQSDILIKDKCVLYCLQKEE